MNALKKWFVLPIVTILLVGGFSACSQDEDLFEYDLGNDEVATLAKRSMPRNGETTNPSQPQYPLREYDEQYVEFKPASGIGNSINVTVVYSFSRNKNGKPIDARCEYYYEPISDFSIDHVSLEEGVLPGRYYLVCEASGRFNNKYIGTKEILL